MNDLPMISCLCVSKNRQSFLKKSIHYFHKQSYPNKELVIVYEGDMAFWNDLSINKDHLTIIDLSSPSSLTLGERRNLSIQHSKGEYICIWDDDDWYHNGRLEIQLKNLLASSKPAIVLDRLLLFDSISGQSYLSSERFWEGSLLCKKEIFTENTKYTHVDKGEDNDFVVKLIKQSKIEKLSAPYLYTYIYHGSNTSDASHFQQLFNAGYKLDHASDLLLRETTNKDLDYEAGSEKVKGLRFEV